MIHYQWNICHLPISEMEVIRKCVCGGGVRGVIEEFKGWRQLDSMVTGQYLDCIVSHGNSDTRAPTSHSDLYFSLVYHFLRLVRGSVYKLVCT